MKKYLVVLAAVTALAGAGYLGTRTGAQEGVKPAAGSSDNKPTTKIGYINITKVIKEFQKANSTGDKILADAKRYEDELKKMQEELKGEQARGAALPTEAEKEAVRKVLAQKEQALRERDYDCQKDIRKRRDDMATEINSNIQRVIDSLARHHGMEMILTCPDVADAKEVGSLSDAMRRMTAPATWVAWKHPGLDLTDECVKWLNHYFPTANGGAPANPMK
jgi:Skp family chaperone for outer membrane proteins